MGRPRKDQADRAPDEDQALDQEDGNAGGDAPGSATQPDTEEVTEGIRRIRHPGMKGKKAIVPGAGGKGCLVQFDADGIAGVTESQAAYLLSIPEYKEVK